jgi:hypothetical protein
MYTQFSGFNVETKPTDGTSALIRWPPMGRKKFMLDGALRGRNELIQDSIYKDTGIRRDRKQVSSHLQVLKQHLKDQPRGEYAQVQNHIYFNSVDLPQCLKVLLLLGIA